MTHHYHHFPTTRMRCIRAVCLLFAPLWGFIGTARAVDFKMKSVSPDFLWSDASADAGTFENVNTISETLYFPVRGRSASVSSHRLSDAKVQSFSGGMSATPYTYSTNSAADAREWVPAGGGINTSSQHIPFENNLSEAEEPSAFPVREASRPQQAVAYSHSRYYTVEAQQHTAAASAYPVYRPMLTQVGAQQATAMAWTSESATTPIRRSNGTDDGWLDPGLEDPAKGDQSPVGEAWALLVLAVLYAGHTSLHRKKATTLTQAD